MNNQAKKALRSTMQQKRAASAALSHSIASNQICTRIQSLECYRDAQHIALYFAANGEIDIDELFKHSLLQKKQCYFPVINEETMSLSFLPVNKEISFKINRYGITEPDVCPDLAIPIDKLDLVLVPLVAFDVRCNRIGMGAGYYDRTFQSKERYPLFGVAYQFQCVHHLDPEPWDVPLKAVITEKAIYWRKA